MSEVDPRVPALRPLWALAGGAGSAATAAWWAIDPGPPWVRHCLLLFGMTALVAAVVRRSREDGSQGSLMWFVAGLALVAGPGLEATADRARWDVLVSNPDTVVRARILVSEGWTESRWGRRSRIRVLQAEAGRSSLVIPGRCRIEIRGRPRTIALPAPGAVVDIVAHPVGPSRHALLVVPSARVVRPTGNTRPLPVVRDRLAHSLLAAGGTNADAIRTAELAAALALGRRDLVPESRRERWRRSGFAHLLAVSGLHVGIVGGSVWLVAALAGAGPRTARLIALVAIPSYAVLAGASPSAMRAALMGVIYLGARFLGRAVVPMAAVLAATVILLGADPGMIGDPGFQLTIAVTAALVRWVPSVASALRGPGWLTGAIAVPLVAQAAAAPIIAWHFRSLVPGAVLANVLALPLLAPTVLGSVVAAVLAPWWSVGAAGMLVALHGLTTLLDMVGGAARTVEIVAPVVPGTASVVLLATGWMALHYGRWSRRAAMVWIGLVMALNLPIVFGHPPAGPGVSMLPVSDGAAVVASSGGDVVLADAGRYPRQATEMLADSGRRRLRVLIASHTDEDHIGGAVEVLRTLRVDNLWLPSWMVSEVGSVPLLRAARHAMTRIVPITRGSAHTFNDVRLTALWPPSHNPPRVENERSLVIRIDLGPGSALITSDIGSATERRLGVSPHLKCDVLVVPHHGSRGGSSQILLDGARPKVALIPAAPGNTHGHPHDEVLQRLSARRIVTRTPLRNAESGVRWNGTRWLPYP